EISYQCDVQGKIAQVIRRLNFQFVSVDVEKPAKRAHCEHREPDCHRPKPNKTIAPERRRNILLRICDSLPLSRLWGLLYSYRRVVDRLSNNCVKTFERSSHSERRAGNQSQGRTKSD